MALYLRKFVAVNRLIITDRMCPSIRAKKRQSARGASLAPRHRRLANRMVIGWAIAVDKYTVYTIQDDTKVSGPIYIATKSASFSCPLPPYLRLRARLLLSPSFLRGLPVGLPQMALHYQLPAVRRVPEQRHHEYGRRWRATGVPRAAPASLWHDAAEPETREPHYELRATPAMFETGTSHLLSVAAKLTVSTGFDKVCYKSAKYNQ
ncbi:hypothetical protein EW146_g8226 [Bondarzewia mesenterica]|uniref:Uncharacterized protein n=1 Tax=Bondarzewia mesenterica TaxID=1095465 RepID=A0A4S4LG55_9AGAM|nr:hypothetical protein EW146_g8226 [Bondarzewia mesenterica]